MRRFLVSALATLAVAAPVFAADITSPPPPPPAYPPPPPLFTWTGVYIGAHLGWGWDVDSVTVFPPGFGTSFVPNGIIGGAHIGYNQQLNQFVIGLEGDVDGTGIDKSFSPGGALYETKIPVQGSIRARLGVAFDRALLYATGGVQFADFDTSVAGLRTVDQTSQGRAGWTVGGGIEYALTGNWSVRAEYRFADFGHFAVPAFNTFAPGFTVNHHESENSVTAGFSYKFDPFWGPHY